MPVAYEILRVIYAPHKAFKEIVQKPQYLGPILIMILFIATYSVFGFISLSKSYYDQTTPSGLDEWTENVTYWIADANTIIRVSEDYFNGIFCGNKSIEFQAVNKSQVWMRLNFTEPLNCSASNGYTTMSFKMKWTNPKDKPSNASIYLFSNANNTFYYDLTKEISSNSTRNVWNNFTIPLKPEEWSPNLDLSNISGLMLDFRWPHNYNITVLIDGLFFHKGFKSVMEISSTYLLQYPLFAFTQFTMQWVVLGGLLYILSKLFMGKAAWKTFLTVAGFALMILVIESIANIGIAYAILPTIYYKAGISFNTILENPQLQSAFQAQKVVRIVSYIWTILLCTLGIREMFKFSWIKCAFIAALAYLLSLLVISFLTGGI